MAGASPILVPIKCWWDEISRYHNSFSFWSLISLLLNAIHHYVRGWNAVRAGQCFTFDFMGNKCCCIIHEAHCNFNLILHSWGCVFDNTSRHSIIMSFKQLSYRGCLPIWIITPALESNQVVFQIDLKAAIRRADSSSFCFCLSLLQLRIMKVCYQARHGHYETIENGMTTSTIAAIIL